MKKLLLFSILLLSCFGVFAQQLDWVKAVQQHYSKDYDFINRHTQDPDSNFISWSTVKPSPGGNVIWAGRFSDSITIGSQTYYSNVGIYISQYNNAGNLEWAVVPNSRVNIEDIAVDPTGNTYIIGAYEDSLQIGNQKVVSNSNLSPWFTGSLFLAKISPQGQCLWLKSYDLTRINNGSWHANPIIGFNSILNTDPSGNIIVSGKTNSYQINFDQHLTLPNLPYAGSGFHFVKISPNGTVQWIRNFESYDHVYLFDATVDNAGNTIARVSLNNFFKDEFGNTVPGNEKTSLLKLDPQSNLIWTKQHQYSNYFKAELHFSKITTDNQNNIYVAGDFNELNIDSFNLTAKKRLFIYPNNDTTFVKSQDIFVAKLNSNGDAQWVKQFGAGHAEYFNDVTVDEQSNVYVAGTFTDSTLFGNQSITLSGPRTGDFVAKINPQGNTAWLSHFENITRHYYLGLNYSNENLYINGVANPDTKWNNQALPGVTNYDQLFLAKIHAPNPANPSTPQGQINLSVFPNPVQQQVQFTVTLPNPEPINVALFNVMGQVVRQANYAAGSTIQAYTLPVTGLPGGRYQLQVQTSGAVVTEGVIILQ